MLICACRDTRSCISSALHFAVPNMNALSSKMDRIAPFISPILRFNRNGIQFRYNSFPIKQLRRLAHFVLFWQDGGIHSHYP
jgi:hypothetical protein